MALQKLDAWDYHTRFRGGQWRWLRVTRFGSAVRGITTAPTSQLRPTSRQLLRRVNAFLEWYVRNGRRATKYLQPRVKCSEVDESRDFFCLQKGRCGMVDVAVVLANPVGAV